MNKKLFKHSAVHDALFNEKLLHFYLSVLIASLLGCVMAPTVHAEANVPDTQDVTFNSGFFKGMDKSIDISRFQKKGALQPGDYQLDVLINDKFIGRSLVRVTSNAGSSAVCFRGKDVTAWGLNLSKLKDTHKTVATLGSDCVDISQLLPGAQVNIDQSQLSAHLSIPQIYINSRAGGYISPEYWESGIGLRIKDESGAPITASGTSYTVATAPNGVKTLNFSFELIKLSNSIAQASSTQSWYLSVNSQEYANGGNADNSNVKLSMTIQRPSIPTCSPSLSVTQVSLQPVSVKDFSGINSAANSKPFSIGLNCEANAAPSVTFSDSTQPANSTSLISLTSGSTASGVALQMLSNGMPVMLSPGGVATAGSSVISPATSASAQTVNIPLAAQYIQSASKITPGSVNGIATFSLTYQ